MVEVLKLSGENIDVQNVLKPQLKGTILGGKNKMTVDAKLVEGLVADMIKGDAIYFKKNNWTGISLLTREQMYRSATNEYFRVATDLYNQIFRTEGDEKINDITIMALAHTEMGHFYRSLVRK